MDKKRMYALTLDVKDSDFKIKYTGYIESNNLTEVLARFPLELNRILKQIAKDDAVDNDLTDDDIPF